MSCKSVSKDFSNVDTTIITEKYKTGEVKRIGSVETSSISTEIIRLGKSTEYYKNGQIKEVGNYENGDYNVCGIVGPISVPFVYKTGFWKYFYENGQLKAEGKFELKIKIGKDKCAGDSIFKSGKVTDKWMFFDKSGKIIEPSKQDIAFIEERSFLTLPEIWD